MEFSPLQYVFNAALGPNVIAVIASGHRIILFSPNVIVVSDSDDEALLHLFMDIFVVALASAVSRNILGFLGDSRQSTDDGGGDDDVENLLITMFKGSTRRAIQVSSGAKIIDLGLKS